MIFNNSVSEPETGDHKAVNGNVFQTENRAFRQWRFRRWFRTTLEYALRIDELVTMCGHKSLERMSDEHEFEVVIKYVLLGGGRQFVEQMHVAVDTS